jgi:hypothetical protein
MLHEVTVGQRTKGAGKLLHSVVPQNMYAFQLNLADCLTIKAAVLLANIFP